MSMIPILPFILHQCTIPTPPQRKKTRKKNEKKNTVLHQRIKHKTFWFVFLQFTNETNGLIKRMLYITVAKTPVHLSWSFMGLLVQPINLLNKNKQASTHLPASVFCFCCFCFLKDDFSVTTQTTNS